MSWYTPHTPDSYIDWTAVSGDLSPGTGDFTLLARIEADTVTYGVTDQGTIISREAAAYELMIYQGFLYCYVASALPATQMAIATGRHSVGFRRSGTTCEMWLDGAFGTSGTSSANVTGTSNLQVLSRPGTSGTNLEGRVQDAGLWFAALTASEMAAYHAGFPAKRIRPQSLKWNPPMVRNLGDSRQARTQTQSGVGPAAFTHLRSYGP